MRWAPSGANIDLKNWWGRVKMKRVREIYNKEWRRGRKDAITYKGLMKDYIGDISAAYPDLRMEFKNCGAPPDSTQFLV